MRITTYRFLSLVLAVLLLAAITAASVGDSTAAGYALLAIAVIVLAQASMLRCHHCGLRPGVWILAIWTLFLDPELYLLDTALLRSCPGCGESLAATQF